MTTISAAKKVILVTGANAGLGFQCSLQLAQQANTHVILAGRSRQRIDEAVARVKQAVSSTSIVEGAIVDLASLASVRQLARGFIQRDLQFYTIVCNAGLMQDGLTVDGYEMTVGVNHIAHFLLVELLKDRTKHILVVGSEAHDPADIPFKAAPAPDMTDLEAMARGTQKYNGPSFYARSKLCNILHAKEFARRHPTGPQILSYTPGFAPDTEIFRGQNVVFVFLFKLFVPFILKLTGGRVSSSAYSGGYMARIASADSWAANGWTSGGYIRVDEVWEASKQACDPELGKALWDKSVEWVKAFTN